MNDRHAYDSPTADPSGIEEPHDVLAAEEFAMPTREERYPADPTGTAEPHDVLAAEEFAMPTAEAVPQPSAGRPAVTPWLAFAGLLLAILLLARRAAGGEAHG